MKKYIFGERNGIYIIDLEKTMACFEKAAEFLSKVTEQGKSVLFVGTKKQAQEVLENAAKKCEMPYVNHRWLGGTLTNFRTIQKRIKYRNDLAKKFKEGTLEGLTKKEVQKRKVELPPVDLGLVADVRELLVEELRDLLGKPA